MWVLCFLLLAARANSLPQESETTTFPSSVDEAVAIDNDVLEALEQELIRNNITLTRDAEIPKDIAQIADHYDRVLNTLSRLEAELPSLRKGSIQTGSTHTGSTDKGSLKKKAAVITAFGVGSIVSLAKVALVLIVLNSGVRQATVSMTGSVTGTLTLRQAAAPFGPTVITGTLTGLTVGMHGISIHEFGNLDGGCTSTGGHYNPFNVGHAGPTNSTRHVGDLGNINVLTSSPVSISITDSQVLLVGPTSVIGRAVVVHESKDDLGLGGNVGSQTTGNAGKPVGCGVIGGA